MEQCTEWTGLAGHRSLKTAHAQATTPPANPGTSSFSPKMKFMFLGEMEQYISGKAYFPMALGQTL